MKIIIDAMGGDNAPVEIVRGALNAARARQDLDLVLVGREADIKAAAQCGASQLPAQVRIAPGYGGHQHARRPGDRL